MAVRRQPQRRGIPLSMRIARDLHDEIAALAEAENESMTRTVERLLAEALMWRATKTSHSPLDTLSERN